MSQIDKKALNFWAEAFGQLKDSEDKNACYIRYQNKDEKYIEFIMKKSCYYYGAWAFFIMGAYVCTVEEELLKELYESETNA